MNKHVIAAASLAALISTGAMAQGYVSVDGGVSRLNADCTGTIKCDRSGNAFKITAGYVVSPALAVELGYIDFGKAKFSDATVSATAKANGLTVGAAYELALAPEWNFTLRGGVARMKTKISGTVAGEGSGSASENNTAPYFGLGLNYAVSTSFKVQTGMDFSRAEFDGEKGNVRALTVGARFDF